MRITAGIPTLNTRTLELASGTVWTGGELRLNGPAEVHNLAGQTFDVGANLILNDNDAAATEWFHNFGTIRRSAGTGRATWDARLRHHAGGLIQIQQGELYISADTVSEAGWQVDADSSVQLPAGHVHQFASGTTASGAGKIWLNGATVDVNANVTLHSAFEFSAGVLEGAGRIALSGPVTWRGGTMRGSGAHQRTRIDGPFQISAGLPILDGRKLELNGDTTWSGGEIRIANRAIIENLTGSEFIVTANLPLNDISAGTSERFINHGVVRRTSGTGTLSLQTEFENHGDLILDVGNLTIDQFRQESGRTILSGSTIRSARTFELLGGTLYGPGSVDGRLVNEGTIVTHFLNSPGELRIGETYEQRNDGRLELTLFGPTPAAQDRLLVGQNATLAGALRINRSDGYEPAIGVTFEPLKYPRHSGEFTSVIGNVGAGKSVSLSYDATQVTGTIVDGQATGEVDVTRQILNTGLDLLRRQIDVWAEQLDVARLLVAEQIAEVLALPGRLAALAGEALEDISPIQPPDYSGLKQALTSAGLEVLCVAGEAVCDTVGEKVRARWNYSSLGHGVDPLSGLATFADTDPGLLSGISDELDLGGGLTVTSDLVVSLTFGVDQTGFFVVGGESHFDLTNINAMGNLTASGRVGTTLVSFAGLTSSDIDVTTTLGQFGVKHYQLVQIVPHAQILETSQIDVDVQLVLAPDTPRIDYGTLRLMGPSIGAAVNVTYLPVNVNWNVDVDVTAHADQVELRLGDFVTLRGGGVDIQFLPDPNQPFISFGANPGVQIEFEGGSPGGPLDGLQGTVGNFGIGFDAGAPLGLKFYRFEDFFTSITVPDGFQFGLPDWLPAEVTEIGLAFGDAIFGSDSFAPTLDELDELTDVTLIVSGGIRSEDEWPITASFDELRINVKKLKDCGQHVAEFAAPQVAAAGSTLGGMTLLIATTGLEILQHCEFPIENLDAVEMGFDPFSIGGITIGDVATPAFTIGGALGFGLMDVLIDKDGDGVKNEEENVLFGRVMAEFGVNGSGAGIELIVTEYGPILGRLSAALPVPIGAIVGALIGSLFVGVGASAGYKIGDETGFLMTGFEGGIIFGEDPLPHITDPQRILEDAINDPLDITLTNVRNKLRIVAQQRHDGQAKYTWSDGFTVAVSGFLTNRYVKELIGVEGTFGMNVGFGDCQDQTPQDQTPDAGVQFFGFGDLRSDIPLMSGDLARTGVLLDIRCQNPFEPTLNAALRIPTGDNRLRLLFPAAAEANLRVETTGIFQGAIAGVRGLIDGIKNSTLAVGSSYFRTITNHLTSQWETTRRAWVNAAADNRPPLPQALRYLLGKADNQPITAQDLRNAISADFIYQRALALLPAIQNLADMTTDQLIHAAVTANALFDALLVAGGELLTTPAITDFESLMNSIGNALDDIFAEIDAAVPILSFVPPTPPGSSEPWPSLPNFQTELSQAQAIGYEAQQLLALFMFNVRRELLETAVEVYEIVDPSLVITGDIQPTIVGIPIGEPISELGVRLDKHGLAFSAQTTVGQVLNAVGIVNAVLGGPDIAIGSEVSLPIGDLYLATLFNEADFPPLSTADPNWSLELHTALRAAGFDLASIRGLVVPPVADEGMTPAWRARIQKLWGPNAGDQLHADLIPIQTEQRFKALEDYGGILLSGLLQVPHLLTDPIDTLANLPPLPAEPAAYLSWLGHVADTLSQLDQPGQFQVYFPSLTKALEPQPIGADRCDVLSNPAACVIDPSKKAEIESAAFVEGTFNGQLLGIELVKARIEGSLNEIGLPVLSVIAHEPLAGAELEIEFSHDERTVNTPTGTKTVSFPIAHGAVTLDESKAETVIEQLGIPAEFLPPSEISNASGSIRAFSPGYSDNSNEPDLLKKIGGVEFAGQFDVDLWNLFDAHFAGSVNTAGGVSLNGQVGSANSPGFNFAAPTGFGLPLTGQISGHASFMIERGNLIAPFDVTGSFSGSLNVVGQRAVSVNGVIDGQGCLTATAELLSGAKVFSHPLVAGACIPHLSVRDALVTEANNDVDVEITFDLSRLNNIDTPVHYSVMKLPAGSPSRAGDDDFVSVAQGSFLIPKDQTSHTIDVTILGDTEWESIEYFHVQITSVVSAVIADEEALVTIVDDDLQQTLDDVFAALEPADDALVYYDFQTTSHAFELSPDRTAPAFVAASSVTHNRGISSSTGLPQENGAGLAARGAPWQAGDYFQFTANLGHSALQLADREAVLADVLYVEFWDRPHTAGGSRQSWRVEVQYDNDTYELPLESQLVVDNEFFAANNLPPDASITSLLGWRRNRFNFDGFPQLGYLLPEEQPAELRFRLHGELPVQTRIDHLQFRGQVTDPCESEFESVQCLESVIAETIRFIDQIDRRIVIDVVGGGRAEAILSPPSDEINPVPQELVSLIIHDADPNRTQVMIRDTTTQPAPADYSLPIGELTSDTGLLLLDLSGVSQVTGRFATAGPIRTVRADRIAPGSSFEFAGTSRDRVHIETRGSVGERTSRAGVDLAFPGQINVGGAAWYGGTWDVGGVDRVEIRGGSFTPTIDIERGFNAFEVTGGDFAPRQFRSGTGAAAGDGTGGTIRSIANNRGVGGSIIGGMIHVDGDLQSMIADGGSIQTQLVAHRVTDIRSTRDASSDRGGDIAGTIDVLSLEQMTSTGGAITANLLTRDAEHPGPIIESLTLGTRGGVIDSRFSFQLAGGVRRIVGRDVSLRLESAGPVGSILVTPGLGSADSRFVGQVVAPRIDEVIVAAGIIDFAISITEPDSPDRKAIGAISVPDPSMLNDRIQLPPQATIGRITDSRTSPAVRGDVNQDGRLNAADIDLLCERIDANDLAYDLNQDRLLNVDDLNHLIERQWLTGAGDANLDGLFNSADLVLVFQAGEYEDARRGNSTWSDGDWNCDGEFTTADLVLAFQRGRYVHAAQRET